MLDNLQLIPGEAFTATSDFSIKLLEKISNAIGWIAIPKNTKKYKLEAEEYLIEQIKNDTKIPPLIKAASISNVRTMIKQYVNQCDIYLEAMKYLSAESDNEKINELEDDWLEFFFDNAKHIGKEEMQLVWAKLLSKQIENPNSVSKQLLHILSIIDSSEANAFMKLANFTIDLDGSICVIISLDDFDEIYLPYDLKQGHLFRLIDIGLIQYNSFGYYTSSEPIKTLTYFDKEISINKNSNLFVGNIILSKAGEELMSIITDRKKIPEFENSLPKILTK